MNNVARLSSQKQGSLSLSCPPEASDGKGIVAAQQAVAASAHIDPVSLASRTIVVGPVQITFSSANICERLKGRLTKNPALFRVLAGAIERSVLQGDVIAAIEFIRSQFDSDTAQGCVYIARVLRDLARCYRQERPGNFDPYFSLLEAASNYITKKAHSEERLQAGIHLSLALALLERDTEGDEERAIDCFGRAKANIKNEDIDLFIRNLIGKPLIRLQKGVGVKQRLAFILEQAPSLSAESQTKIANRLYTLHNRARERQMPIAIDYLRASASLLIADDPTLEMLILLALGQFLAEQEDDIQSLCEAIRVFKKAARLPGLSAAQRCYSLASLYDIFANNAIFFTEGIEFFQEIVSGFWFSDFQLIPTIRYFAASLLILRSNPDDLDLAIFYLEDTQELLEEQIESRWNKGFSLKEKISAQLKPALSSKSELIIACFSQPALETLQD